MDELRQESTTTEDDWDIDLSDVDITDENADADNTEDADLNSDEADQQNQTEGDADNGEAEADETKETDQLTLKYLGEEKTVSRDEAITLAQKGMDYDRIRQKFDELTTAHSTLSEDKVRNDEKLTVFNELAKRSGFNNVNDFIDNIRANIMTESTGIDKSVALEKLKLERERNELRTQADASNSPEAVAKQAEEKRQNDFKEFVSEYRDVKPTDISKEVWDIYGRGNCSLVQAYIKHENAQLKSKLDADHKTAENRERSTGSRVSVGKTAAKDFEDTLWYSD